MLNMWGYSVQYSLSYTVITNDRRHTREFNREKDYCGNLIGRTLYHCTHCTIGVMVTKSEDFGMLVSSIVSST